jgi:hypothetical protein
VARSALAQSGSRPARTAVSGRAPAGERPLTTSLSQSPTTQQLFITGPQPRQRHLSPYRRRLHWTPPFAGCDSDNLLCGSGSACEAAVAPSSPLTTHSTCQPAAPPAGNIQHSLVARLQARCSFNVRGRALSQTPASLLQSAFSGTRTKVCLCCAAPAHPAAFGSHVTYMERANLIAPARRRHIPDTTKHLWLPRTHDWKGIEQ